MSTFDISVLEDLPIDQIAACMRERPQEDRKLVSNLWLFNKDKIQDELRQDLEKTYTVNMTGYSPITRASLVPWYLQDPHAPSDLTGWALVPQTDAKLPDPAELERILRYYSVPVIWLS